MQSKKVIKFKKNSKVIRLNKLYFDLLKTKHLLSFFVGGLKQHQLVKLYKVTLNHQRFFAFLKKLECRLEFILLKTGIVLTGKQAKQLILHGHIFVNKKQIKAYNYQLKLYDLISIEKSFISNYKTLLICNLFKTLFFMNFLRKKKVFKKLSMGQLFVYVKFPFFLEINYKTFTLCLVRTPALPEFFFPKILSLYDCNQLYFNL